MKLKSLVLLTWIIFQVTSLATAQNPPQASVPNQANLKAIRSQALAVKRAQGVLRHKLNQATRRRIAGEEEVAFHQALILSEKKFPLSSPHTDVLRAGQFQDTIWQQRLSDLGRKYHLSRIELAAILEEGRDKGWVPSKPGYL